MGSLAENAVVNKEHFPKTHEPGKGRRKLDLAIGMRIDKDAMPGLVLLMFGLLAIGLANSGLAGLYRSLLSTPVVFSIGAFAIDKPLLLWVNDGLMAVFFFLVGLEIKRELLQGELSSWRKASLPVIAALGGMIVPSLIYIGINIDNGDTLRGWAIPAATDIAFALGVLALLGSRVPIALKVFLLALAILDDLGAIVIIAVFYTADLSLASLAIGVVGATVLIGMNLAGVTRPSFYILIGIVIWAAVLKSGVHATLAGVLVAFTVPLRTRDRAPSPLLDLEHGLKPWVAYCIMPAFAFANAGVALRGMSLADLFAPVPLGIALGLFIGKQVGVMAFSWLGVRFGICGLPQGTTWTQLYGVGLLAGIGFTMSLFIGTLAFTDAEIANAVRLGVLSGSCLSGIVGFIVLRRVLPAGRPAHREEPAVERPSEQRKELVYEGGAER
jgi:Na+:H+ antiporter, NhaA family